MSGTLYGDFSVWLVDATGLPIAEPVIESARLESALNDAGEAEITLDLFGQDELFDITKPWCGTQIVATVDETPVWMGPIVKRRGPVGKGTSVTITGREWEGWLNRVSVADITPTHDQEDAIDAATLVAQRINDVCWKAYGLKHAVPAINLMEMVPGATPATVSVEWVYGDGQAIPTVWEELRDVINQGVDIRIVPHWDGTRFTPRLWVSKYAPTSATVTVLTVGEQIAETELFENGDRQVTRWNLTGTDETVGVGRATDHTLPLLEDWKSLPTVDDTAILAGRGESLLLSTVTTEITADEVSVARDCPPLRVGDHVLLDVPPDLDERAPNGQEIAVRVESITWALNADDGLDVQLRLAQPWTTEQSRFRSALAADVAPAPPGQRYTAVTELRGNRDRISLEERSRFQPRPQWAVWGSGESKRIPLENTVVGGFTHAYGSFDAVVHDGWLFFLPFGLYRVDYNFLTTAPVAGITGCAARASVGKWFGEQTVPWESRSFAQTPGFGATGQLTNQASFLVEVTLDRDVLHFALEALGGVRDFVSGTVIVQRLAGSAAAPSGNRQAKTPHDPGLGGS